MARSHPHLLLRPLTSDDLAEAVAVVQASGLGVTADDLRRQALLPMVILVGAWHEDRLAGAAGAIAYGSLGVIGPMSVLPQAQGRGIGTALLRWLLDWLHRRGAGVITLDATPAGAPLYRRHGFVTDYWTLHLVRKPEHPVASTAQTSALAAASDAQTSALAATSDARAPALAADVLPEQWTGSDDVQVTAAGPADLPAIDRFDAPLFGASRHAVLAQFLADFSGRAVQARRDGGLAGYAVAQEQRIGPVMAQDSAAAAAIFAALLALPFPAAPVVSVPHTNAGAVALLAGQGFAEARRLERMRLGGERHPGDPTRVYGVATYALG